MSDESIIPGLSLAPAVLNEEAANAARKRIEGALTTARERRDASRTAYGSSIENTLRAIDETTKSLQRAHEGQWNLPLMAFGAGMLKGTPGVASNFLTELGGGMEAAVPAIARQRMSDNEFLNKVGELKRMRELTAGEPAKLDMASADKERDRLLAQQQALDTATLRSVPGNQLARDKMAAQEAQAASKMLEQMTQHSQSSVADLLKKKEDISAEEQELLRRYDLQRRIDQYNAQSGVKPLINPMPLTQEDIERAKKLLQSVDEKGLSERNAKVIAEIQDKAEKSARESYKEVWSSLTDDQRRALIENEMLPRIKQHNDQNAADKKKQITSWEPTKDLDAARTEAGRLLNPARVDKEDVNSAGLPVSDIPKTFEGMTYSKRMELMKTKEREAEKQIEEARNAANKAPAAETAREVENVLRAYERTSRKGAVGGNAPTWGSKDAQLVEQFVNQFKGKDNPLAGTGQITDFERKLIDKMVINRDMEPDMFKYMAARHAANAALNQAKSEFLQTWAKTHRTLDGADIAWNRYLRSNEGSIVDEKASRDRKFPVLKPPMEWREFFRRENATASGGKPSLRWDPNKGDFE